MLRCEHLSRRFGPIVAVDDVSLTVEAGEVVGLLGENGAGKSSLMRLLTGFLPADGGVVEVDGYQMLRERGAAQRRIGYLPEEAAAYGEMRVSEYLRFRAALRGLGRRQRPLAVDAALGQCALTDVADRLIGRLSRGFRQRVGLAAALLGDPAVLILDEPTVGLDPNQARQINDLIDKLGKRCAVLLSSHQLGHLEQTCSRVLLMHRGRLHAVDGIARSSLRRADALLLRVAVGTGDLQALIACLGQLAAIDSVVELGRDRDEFALSLSGQIDASLAEQVAASVFAQGWALRALEWRRDSLEERFSQLTTGRQ
ncbi:MAG: ABC transporter ATP-binding protein [Deltaproteobacteria bacterium]|nr:ABC transporter ATP-binding protein [Deltaproteobacteria bacterium]